MLPGLNVSALRTRQPQRLEHQGNWSGEVAEWLKALVC